MPEPSRAQRVKKAKSRGITMAVKESDVTGARTLSSHASKKSGGIVTRAGFDDRNVSTRRSPGLGKTARGKALPLPDADGATGQRRKTLPTEAAAAYRKENRRKLTGEAAAPDVKTPKRKLARDPSLMDIKRTISGTSRSQRDLHKDARKKARATAR
jgi:hypothetical protein